MNSDKTIILYPNAKLNLNLYINGLKKTWWGAKYHQIMSLMVPITLYDRMIIKPGKFEINYRFLNIEANENSFNNENCIIRKTLKKLNIPESEISYSFTIEKNIPLSSGLGGGSSNAAFFLKFLIEKKILKFKSKSELYKKACEIGSDVPFFLSNKPSFIYNFGEKQIILKNFPKIYFVIFQPFKKISTEIMYKELDNMRSLNKNELNIFKENFIKKKIRIFKKNYKKHLQNNKNYVLYLREIANNDFEVIVSNKYENFSSWKLLFNKSLFAQMSGAGSSIFGVFANYQDAKVCYDYLTKIHGRVYICSCKT